MFTEIFQDTNISSFFYQGGSKYLLLTFAPLNFNSTEKNPFWGAEFSTKNDITTIGVVAKTSNWYPDESISRLRSEVIEYSRQYADVLAYGTSMGGYGAIKHGKCLGARYALGFSPQASIDPGIV